MKKILCVMLVLVFAFTFSACGNDQPGTADMEAQVAVDAGEGGSAVDSSDEEDIIADGAYRCFDRFNGEEVGSVTLTIHESNRSQVVFDYTSPAGSIKGATAYLDSSGCATVSLSDTATLEMTFKDYEIEVDEIEGMGAMAYVFKK